MLLAIISLNHPIADEMFLQKRLSSLLPTRRWKPLVFPSTGFQTFGDDVLLEEEGLPDYSRDALYPVRLGEVFTDRYQVVGKLGFGMSSTVWLARDMQCVS